MRWLLLVVAACGDNAAALVDAPPRIDAALPDAAPAIPCDAIFSGSFSVSEEVPANCAMVSTGSGGTAVAFEIAALPIGSDLAIQIMLASPVPGTYNAGSTAEWSAMATQVQQGASRCYYVAGDASVPPGTFAMTIDAFGSNTAHGQLSLELAVLATPATYCGSGTIEDLALRF